MDAQITRRCFAQRRYARRVNVCPGANLAPGNFKLKKIMKFFITDPTNCTIYNRSERELEEFLLFCIAVAGKNAQTTRRILQNFWSNIPERYHCNSPFGVLTYFCSPKRIAQYLKDSGMGCYNLKALSFFEIARSDIDLRNCTIEDLEKFPGIGKKTSRFFLLHSRPGQRLAVLDTHILKFMRDNGISTPLATPQGKLYTQLEERFLNMVPEGMSVAEFDLAIWNRYSKKRVEA